MMSSLEVETCLPCRSLHNTRVIHVAHLLSSQNPLPPHPSLNQLFTLQHKSCSTTMADYNRDRPHQIHVHPQPGSGITTTRLGHHQDGNGPSASQVVAVATLLPVSGTLLGLAGLTLVGTLIGLAVVAPLFVIFSPVLVPAFLATVLAVAAFLASGAFGMTGICSLSRALDCIRGELPEAKRKAAEVAAYAGEKTEEAGRTIQQKAQESGGRA